MHAATTVATTDNSREYSLLLLLLPFLPYFSTPLHIQHQSTGSLVADSTQEILHRSLAQEYKTVSEGVKIDPFSTLSSAIKCAD